MWLTILFTLYAYPILSTVLYQVSGTDREILRIRELPCHRIACGHRYPLLTKASHCGYTAVQAQEHATQGDTTMSIRARTGFDAGDMCLEEALEWAARYSFHYVDFNADQPPNALDAWDEARVRAIRQHCERANIHLGLHTLSGVHVAEFSPYVSEAMDTYLRANIDVAQRLGCVRLVVHAGFHFSANVKARQADALEHLQRAVTYMSIS